MDKDNEDNEGVWVRRFLVFIVLLAWSGLGPNIIHYRDYDGRKDMERAVFAEYAVPQGAQEIRDDSYEKFKTVTIAKTYRYEGSKEDLMRYYKNKLEGAGWQWQDLKPYEKRLSGEQKDDTLRYYKDDLHISITFEEPDKVWVRLLYAGEDADC